MKTIKNFIDKKKLNIFTKHNFNHLYIIKLCVFDYINIWYVQLLFIFINLLYFLILLSIIIFIVYSYTSYLYIYYWKTNELPILHNIDYFRILL